MCVGNIFDVNGNRSSSFNYFPHFTKQVFGNAIYRKLCKTKYGNNKVEYNHNIIVEVCSGSCMFFDSKVFCEIGGFDTNFFLYCEEEDICKRVIDYGKSIYFIPNAKLLHSSGGSTNRKFEIEKEFYISYYHLLSKHHFILKRIVIKMFLFFKLFFRIFKKKYGFKLFLSMLKGFPIKDSLKYKQKIMNNDY